MASTATAASTAAAAAPASASNNNKKKRVQWATDVIDNESKNSAKTYMKSHLASNEGNNKTKKKKKICSFCGRNPAAVVVKGRGRTKKKQALCLLHYYTTSAVHVDEEGSEFVDILDPTLVQEQLNGNNNNKSSDDNNDGDSQTTTTKVQELFAEAFVQLQQELAQESLTIPVVQPERKKNPRKAPPENDPLGMLHDLGRQKKRQRKPPPPVASNNNNGSGGGFLKPIPVPERLRKTQQQQAQIQAELVARMNRVAKAGAAGNNNKREDMSKRRQPTKKSIWNVVLDEKPKGAKKGGLPKKKKNEKPTMSQVLNNTFHEEDTRVEGVTCTCGSNNVSSVGNITNRNADVRKGEIWGSGANDDVVEKYRCNQCGKSWSETV